MSTDMESPVTRPAAIALLGATLAFGSVLAVDTAGVIGESSSVATVAIGSSFGLTVGFGLFLVLTALQAETTA